MSGKPADEPHRGECSTVQLMLASHLIATAAAQEPGQLRWQNLRTGRARCQWADLFGTGQSTASVVPATTVNQPYIYTSPPLEVNVLNCRGQGRARAHDEILAMPRSATNC